VTALLDETAAWAVIHALGRMCTTIQLTVTFRQPVPGGSKVVVTGENTGTKGRFQLARSEMRDDEGRLLATAEGRFMLMPEEVHREVVPMLKMPGRPAVQDDI
jgi:acyl-coenzyme A thioesterase PaaI-like protein